MSKEGDYNVNMFLLFIGVLILLWASWYFFGDNITSGYRWLKVGQLWVYSLFTDEHERLRLALANARVAGEGMRGGLTWPMVWGVSAKIGEIMRWPVVIMLCIFAYISLYKTNRNKFRTKYNLESLMAIQSKVWPVISPIIKFNPLKVARVPGSPVPEDLPAMAESLSPQEWLAWAKIPLRDGTPDKEAVRQAFITQVGVRWQGLAGLKLHHKALVAAFALKGAQKRQEAYKLLGEIANCWSPTTGLQLTLDVQKQIDAVLKDQKLMAPALEVAANYAYRTTALLAMLAWARARGGVLAPAEFLWLRAVDRPLWYPLNNLGRRSYHAEASGAMAHYMAEKFAGNALLVPRVETAVAAFIEYIKESEVKIPPLAAGGIKQTAALKFS